MKRKAKRGLQVNNIRNKKLLALFKFSIILFSSLSFMFWIYYKHDFYNFQIYEALILSYIFNLERLGNTLQMHDQGLYISITKECIGFKTFAFLFALILATPNVSIKRKIVLLAISPFLALFINICRISLALILVMMTNAQFYRIYDHILLAILNSFIVIMIWYITTLRHVKPIKD